MTNNTLFLGIDHINVRTTELEKSIKFYTEVLGFSLLKRFETPMRLALLSLNGTVVEFSEIPEMSSFQDGFVNHWALNVSDIFATFELLKDQGVEFIPPASEPVKIENRSYYFFFRGPSGERIEAVQNI